jgi:maltooligosyltrehalose synthase
MVGESIHLSHRAKHATREEGWGYVLDLVSDHLAHDVTNAVYVVA